MWLQLKCQLLMEEYEVSSRWCPPFMDCIPVRLYRRLIHKFTPGDTGAMQSQLLGFFCQFCQPACLTRGSSYLNRSAAQSLGV